MTVGKKVALSLLRLPAADHRQIGLRQKLFFFNELSQGSCFFQPRGTHIYNKLIEYLRSEYKKRHYEEVITPNIYDCQLWKTSGHWDHYESNMIKFQLSEREFSLKPMNCPGHCLMFKNQETKSDHELPVRWADFGVLHRNELSGSLLGLSRVRRFQQDDAHIFCTPDQVESEVKSCLDFANEVYTRFGFKSMDLKLSLRPKSFMGDEKLWDNAEDALRRALDRAKVDWVEQKFEGAFYGPKIDLIVKDCNQRAQQCATIQLDFQLPERFELSYRDSNSKQPCRPVIIHRAILGSIERFIAMIAENCNGIWPFWLSPLQAQVIPIHPNLGGYAKEVRDELRDFGYWVDCDLTTSTLNAKIREAILTRYNFILIVGQNEADSKSVTCRILSNINPKNDVESLSHAGDDSSSGSANKEEPKVYVDNINIPLDELICHFKKFVDLKVNRPDIELLKLSRQANKNGRH